MTMFIGTDPEFFLYDTKKKEFISGHGLVPGTKDKPQPFETNKVFSRQLDGLACELGLPPVKGCASFTMNIQLAKKLMQDSLPAHIILSDVSSVFFPRTYYENDIPEECKVLGCTPDRDAYNKGKYNTIPPVFEDKEKGYLRTAGGHIHIGWTSGRDATGGDKEHLEDCILLIKNIDYLYNLYQPAFDGDELRRKMYGKPGCFRIKPYGCEYRTPSNAWLKSEVSMKFIYEIVDAAFCATNIGELFSDSLGRFTFDKQTNTHSLFNIKQKDVSNFIATYRKQTAYRTLWAQQIIDTYPYFRDLFQKIPKGSKSLVN